MSYTLLLAATKPFQGRPALHLLRRRLTSSPDDTPGAAARCCEIKTAGEYGAAVQRSMHVGQMLAFHSESDAASQECIQRLRLLVEKRANVHLATIDIRNPELKSVLARVKVQKVPTVFALTSGTILDVRTGPQSPLELARFVERFAQAVPA